MDKLFANSEDPDQKPRSAASDLGLHRLPITLLRVSQLQWGSIIMFSFTFLIANWTSYCENMLSGHMQTLKAQISLGIEMRSTIRFFDQVLRCPLKY